MSDEACKDVLPECQRMFKDIHDDLKSVRKSLDENPGGVVHRIGQLELQLATMNGTLNGSIRTMKWIVVVAIAIVGLIVRFL